MSATADESRASIRRTVFFSGRVQGVGFRFTTEGIAARFAVSGFVRNLPDGRVELVAEGTAGELDRFQDAIKQTMHRQINEVNATDAVATGEFRSFQIAF